MIRRPPRSTRTDTLFPTRRSSDLLVKRIYEHTDRVAARHPGIEFVKAPYLNDHPLVFDTFADRVREILDGANLMNCQMCKYREQVLGFEGEVGLPQERSEEHTSELQSLMRTAYDVFCLKKNKQRYNPTQ